MFVTRGSHSRRSHGSSSRGGCSHTFQNLHQLSSLKDPVILSSLLSEWRTAALAFSYGADREVFNQTPFICVLFTPYSYVIYCTLKHWEVSLVSCAFSFRDGSRITPDGKHHARCPSQAPRVFQHLLGKANSLLLGLWSFHLGSTQMIPSSNAQKLSLGNRASLAFL